MSQFLFLRKFKNFHSNSNILLNPFKPATENSKTNFPIPFLFRLKDPASHYCFLLICAASLRPNRPFWAHLLSLAHLGTSSSSHGPSKRHHQSGMRPHNHSPSATPYAVEMSRHTASPLPHPKPTP
jgi:hypothetical protein